MSKRILIILTVIILLSLTAGAILLLTRNNQPEPEVFSQPQVKQLVDEQVISPIASFDQSAIWYFTPRGQLFRINLDGTGLSEFPLPPLPAGTLVAVQWPLAGNDFMALTSSGLGELKHYYDAATKEYVTLPASVRQLDWLPDSERIVYIWKLGDGAQQLKVATPDTSGFRTITDLFWDDYAVKASPAGNRALLYRVPASGELNKIYRVDLASGEVAAVLELGRNTDVRWLPGGEKFIFEEELPNGATRLLLYHLANRQITDLNLATTLDRTALAADGAYLYAAVPRSEGSGDRFVKVDLLAFNQETVFEPVEDLRVKSALVINGTIYFVSATDGKLYFVSKQ